MGNGLPGQPINGQADFAFDHGNGHGNQMTPRANGAIDHFAGFNDKFRRMHDTKNMGLGPVQENIGFPIERQVLVGAVIDVGLGVACLADDKNFNLTAIVINNVKRFCAGVFQIIKGT